MLTSANLLDLLRAIATGLRIPVIVLLLALAVATIIMLGSVIAELFSERLRLKAKLPLLVEEIRDSGNELAAVINESGLLKRQKTLLLELASHPQLSVTARESLARKLLFQEEARYQHITKITDVIARLGPMLGLLGTLIPLGPGLIALGQGDTFTLSQSFLTAFDTTITGLAAAAVAYVISAVRKSWYENYMTTSETVAICLLERAGKGESQ